MADPALLSIIVPVGPGDSAWRELLPCLQPLPPHCEVLLVAAAPVGGEVPAGLPEQVHWLRAATGRALQQNAGAAAARGALLWFLHCDSRPDRRALDAIARQDSTFDALGWFDLAFHDGGWRHALNAVGARLRARAGLPFGDQGLLLPARRFRALGGFDPQLPLGEDLDLVVRAHAAGLPLRRLPGTVATSARRYLEQGWLRTTARHLWLTVRLLHAARQRLRNTRHA